MYFAEKQMKRRMLFIIMRIEMRNKRKAGKNNE